MLNAATLVRYQVVAASMLMAFILYLDRICLGEIVKAESFLHETALSKEQIGRLLGAFFFTYALFQVPAGWASDRFGGRRMLTGYILLWSILTAVTGLMHTNSGMLAARLGCGIAQAGAYPASGGLIRYWFPITARGNASALVCFGGRMGGTLAPFLTTLLMLQLGGWRAVMGLYGLLGLIVATVYWIFVRDRPADSASCNAAERELIGAPIDDERPHLRDIPALIWSCTLSKSLWCNSIGQFLVNVGWAFLITWLPTYLREVQHVDDITGAWMVSLVLAAGIVGQLLGGVLADWSLRRMGLRWGRVAPLVASSMVAAAAYLMCLFLDSVWSVIALCAVVSLMTDIGNPSTWAFMQDIGGRNTSAVAGWGNMWGNFGATVSSMMVPWLLKIGGDGGTGQQLVFLACAGAFFLSGLLALGMDPTKRLQIAQGPASPSDTASGNHHAELSADTTCDCGILVTLRKLWHPSRDCSGIC